MIRHLNNETLDKLFVLIGHARNLHPSNCLLDHALVEEVGELSRAIQDEGDERAQEEALDVACVALRIYEEGIAGHMRGAVLTAIDQPYDFFKLGSQKQKEDEDDKPRVVKESEELIRRLRLAEKENSELKVELKEKGLYFLALRMIGRNINLPDDYNVLNIPARVSEVLTQLVEFKKITTNTLVPLKEKHQEKRK